LLENFAAQAVIAMENARLLTETRAALEQQTATAEVLQVINASQGDLTPVFDAILEKAHALCGATYGTLTVADGEYFSAVAMHGFTGAFGDFLHQPFRPSPASLQHRLLEGEPLVHIPDISTLKSKSPRMQAAVQAGFRTLLFIPMRKDATLLGHITALRQGVQPFTEKQIALLNNFAAQAVIAMENARLITETREALEQQTATTEVLQVINSSPGDLTPVFEAMLEKAHILCGADNGTLLTYDGERFWIAARHGMSAQLADALAPGIDPNVAPSLGRIVRGERLDHIYDMIEFAAQVSDEAIRRRITALVEIGGIRTQLVIALRKDDLLLGAITANRKVVQPFTDKQIALLENFAAQAVIAMENARLLRTRQGIIESTYERVKYGFTTRLSYHMLWL
jgi:GAF domain-containing protein